MGNAYRVESAIKLKGSAAVLLCMLALQTAPAQERGKQLLVEQVPPSLTDAESPGGFSKAMGGTQKVALSESTSQQITGRQRELTQGEKWEKFESEFGVHQKNPSFMKGTLEDAKYRLDKTVFGLQEWVDNVENTLKFDYPLANPGGSLSPGPSSTRLNDPVPFWGSMEDPRFKSDIDLDPFTRRAFVGVKLVIKFGD
jgi:hypothetical protein